MLRITVLRIRRVELDLKTLRNLMIWITAKIMVLAFVMIIIGFSVYAHFHTFAAFKDDILSGNPFTPALLTALMGIALIIITSFGFLGSLKLSTCMVNTYAYIMILFFVIKLIVVILSFSTNVMTLRESLYIPIQRFVTDREIEAEINQLQKSLNCCGSESFWDYVGLNFRSDQDTSVYPAMHGMETVSVMVPASCCAEQGFEYCTVIRSQGCKMALLNTVMDRTGWISIVGVFATIMTFLGITFALMLARGIRKAKSERGLLSWTITERAIIARRNEAQGDAQNQPQTNQETNENENAAKTEPAHTIASAGVPRF